MTDLSFADAIGISGAALIVVAYLLLQAGRLDARSLAYSVINGVGAAGIIFSLMFDFNLSAFAIEAFWLAISIYGAIRTLRMRRISSVEPRKDAGT